MFNLMVCTLCLVSEWQGNIGGTSVVLCMCYVYFCCYCVYKMEDLGKECTVSSLNKPHCF